MRALVIMACRDPEFSHGYRRGRCWGGKGCGLLCGRQESPRREDEVGQAEICTSQMSWGIQDSRGARRGLWGGAIREGWSPGHVREEWTHPDAVAGEC